MPNMLFANNANTTLSSSLTNVATTMSVTSATGFPSPTGSQYFYCTLADAATQTTIEIVKVTAVSGTTFTIVRGQDGTSGTAFSAGDVVSLRLVRASLNDFPKLDEVNTFSQPQTFSAAPITSTLTGFVYGNGASAQTVATNAQLLTLLGTLPVSNGGTGLTTLTTGYIPYGNGTSAFSSSSNLNFDGNNLGLGTSTPSSTYSNRRTAYLGAIGTSIGGVSGGVNLEIRNNTYLNAAGNEILATTNGATIYVMLNGDHRWYTAPSGTAGTTASYTQQLTLFNSGGVSIGNTTDPGAGSLSVNGYVSAASFRPTSATIPTNGLFLPAANKIGFSANSTEVARFDGSANFYINCTSTPSSTVSGLVLNNPLAAPSIWATGTYTGAAYMQQFVNGNGTVGYIFINGSVTTFASISDYRLKENVVRLTNALDTINKLNPVTYDWIADKSKGQGFIAHELQAVVPDCVTGEKDAVNPDGSIKPQGVDTSFLVSTLTAAIQELNAKFDAYVASHP